MFKHISFNWQIKHENTRNISTFTKIFISSLKKRKNPRHCKWKMVLWKWSTLQGFVLQETFSAPNLPQWKYYWTQMKEQKNYFAMLQTSCTILIPFGLCLYCDKFTFLSIYLIFIPDIKWGKHVIWNSCHHKMPKTNLKHTRVLLTC